MLVIASLALSLVPQAFPQDRKGRLVLPRTRTVQTQPDKPASVSRDGIQDQFHRAVLELRRSLHLGESKSDAIVQRLGSNFDAIPERSLKLLLGADADLTFGIMRVLMTYGGPEQAGELKFRLLTQSFGSSTKRVVETMAQLGRDDATEMLFACLTASRAAVRRHAAEALTSRLRVEDAERLVTLSEQEKFDVQVKSLRLLGQLPTAAAARDRLLRALAQKPEFAAPAAEALVQHGVHAAGELQDVLSQPATGRSFGYAAFALASIEDSRPLAEPPLFNQAMVPHLVAELSMPDPFQRTASAVALAGMAWRSNDTSGKTFHDHDVASALVDVASPVGFVLHLSMVQEIATRRLARLTGKNFGVGQPRWREWWDEFSSIATLVGTRQRVDLDADRARLATLVWESEGMELCVRGEDSSRPLGAEGIDVLLDGEEFASLVTDLEGMGFMGSGRVEASTRDERRLTLNVAGAICRSEPGLVPMVLDRFEARLNEVLEGQRWQIYRDAENEPDFAAFWRAERRWLENHPDAGEQAERLKDRILAVLPDLAGNRAAMAMNDLFAIPDLASRLTEADGTRLIETVEQRPNWGEAEYRLMELAVVAPGDSNWRALLDVSAMRSAEGRDDRALSRIFAMLGPERIRESLSEGRVRAIRIAAIEEVASLRDLSAVDALAEALLTDDDVEVRRTAGWALGKLGAPAAKAPILEMLERDADGDALLRRTLWVAIARVGGEDAFDVLRNAFRSTEPADRRAVIQGLAALRHPAAANELANIFALRGANDVLGGMSLEYLRQLGDSLAAPALRQHLEHADEAVRREVIIALAEFQDPVALPGLIGMLALESDRIRTVGLIAGVTGRDFSTDNDRVGALRAWYAGNRHLPQSRWFLDALKITGVETNLNDSLLGVNAGTAAVPELNRVMVDARQPYLRSLAGRMLRITTGQDFGSVLPATPEDKLRAIAERYSFLYESDRAAAGK